MTGPEHYKRAEGLLDQLRRAHASVGTTVNVDKAAVLLAEAQVHATLALAAASALNDNEPGLPVDDFNEWREAVGTNLQGRVS